MSWGNFSEEGAGHQGLASPAGSLYPRFAPGRLRWPQLSYWGCHVRGNGGHGGFNDPGPREVAEFGISTVHQDGQEAVGTSISHAVGGSPGTVAAYCIK